MKNRSVGLRSLVLLVLALGWLTPGAVRAQEVSVETDGQVFTVTGLDLSFARDALVGHPSLPSVEEILNSVRVELGDFPSGYARYQEGAPSKIFSLAEIGDLPSNRFHASGIEVLSEAIVQMYNSRGVFGLYVTPDPQQIVPVSLTEFEDRRPAGQTTMGIMIWIAMVDETRTVAVGDRIAVD
ncbi:MAG: hypothetical protein ACYTGQ_16770, partial [Planctomycetota bacterium]